MTENTRPPWYIRNPAKARATARLRKYGITVEQHQELFDTQGGVCAICGLAETRLRAGKVQQLCVDHDHDTGEIRGLLCCACNRGLGAFRDNAESLQSASRYVRTWQTRARELPADIGEHHHVANEQSTLAVVAKHRNDVE
jgi:hypothetical protein